MNSSSPVRVAVVGGEGRMGRRSSAWIGRDPRFELAATIVSGDDLASCLDSSGATIGLDFTRAGLGADHARTMLAHGVRPLIGTSGVDSSADAELHHRALDAGLPGLIVPNFSLGVWLQQDLAVRVARVLPDVVIVEEHSQGKVDSPSGTAIDTAERLAHVRGTSAEDICIHSTRLPGLKSNQSVVFGSQGQVLRISHETYGLDAFEPGVLLCLSHLLHAPPGMGRGLGLAVESQGAEAGAGSLSV